MSLANQRDFDAVELGLKGLSSEELLQVIVSLCAVNNNLLGVLVSRTGRTKEDLLNYFIMGAQGEI